jgi:hypothetical protein
MRPEVGDRVHQWHFGIGEKVPRPASSTTGFSVLICLSSIWIPNAADLSLGHCSDVRKILVLSKHCYYAIPRHRTPSRRLEM